jgi:hypothetical protein
MVKEHIVAEYPLELGYTVPSNFSVMTGLAGYLHILLSLERKIEKVKDLNSAVKNTDQSLHWRKSEAFCLKQELHHAIEIVVRVITHTQRPVDFYIQ